MSPYVSPLLIAPDFSQPAYLQLSPGDAGWDYLHFSAVQLRRAEEWSFETGACELALVVLGGTCRVESNYGSWMEVGRRANVFEGMPYALYLPRQARFTVTASSESLDFACGWCLAEQDYPARLITPQEVEMEIRGANNATRQINKMIPPGFPCSRIVMVEVYTPGGNWSSYPPHKHDEHIIDEQGSLLEADLEEIYFYKMRRPEGFAYQRIYTGDGRRDELILARDSHLVLSPEGYHPVVAAPGCDCYYLNMLAGSAQSLAARDDPAYAWVKETWKAGPSSIQDPHLPLVKR